MFSNDDRLDSTYMSRKNSYLLDPRQLGQSTIRQSMINLVLADLTQSILSVAYILWINKVNERRYSLGKLTSQEFGGISTVNRIESIDEKREILIVYFILIKKRLH